MIKRSLISYAVIVFVLFALISMSAYLVDRMIVARDNQIRYDQISQIYESLGLDDSYRIDQTDVFGDKRVYDWDKDRSYSSSVTYGHNATVSATFDDLKKRVEAAGFTYFETAYDGSVAKQLHFKNDKGQYVRVSVVTKLAHDMQLYGVPSVTDWNKADHNAAPSYVTIKVNLDDNNE